MSTLHLDSARIQAIIASMPTINDTLDNLSQFVSSYYNNLTVQNIKEFDDKTLAAIAGQHFGLLNTHQDTHPSLAIFNPVERAHGFDSDFTVVQLVVKDRPFLTDTLLMSLENQGCTVNRVYNTILSIDGSSIQPVLESYNDSAQNKAFFHAEIGKLTDDEIVKVKQALLQSIATIDIVVNDWQAMQERLQVVKNELAAMPIAESYQSKDSVASFLDWIGNNNFIFMGFREYRFDNQGDELELYSVGGSGLGLLKGSSEDALSESFHRLPVNLRHLLTTPRVILLSKSAKISPIHRPVHMDFLGIQKFDNNGNLVGEYRFLGLLTSRAYQTEVSQIPLLKEKTDGILKTLGIIKNGHSHTKTNHIINTLPRDDLFQASIEELAPQVAAISALQDKNALRLFARTDHYQRFVSCLVYIPKHKFDTELRQKIQNTLTEAFGGVSSAFTTDFNELHHVRVHFHIRTKAGQVKETNLVQLERILSEFMADWHDDYRQQLIDTLGTTTANNALKVINFPISYQERFGITQAVADTKVLLDVNDNNALVWQFRRSDEGGDFVLGVYGRGTPTPLSHILPILEDFGVSVDTAQTYLLGGTQKLWLQEYHLNKKPQTLVDDDAFDVIKTQVEEALNAIWQGLVKSDRLNQLILTTKLDAYDVVVLRALSRYMIQATAPFSNEYIHETLINNPVLSSLVVALFHAKMSPDNSNHQEAVVAVSATIHSQIASLKSLDEDRIFGWLLDLIGAMLRTNFYQSDDNGNKKDCLSFKFKASEIAHLPKPKPMFEIFVYSPRVEGVHLRGGKVARGGLRWSDRMEDYRTEVLGLVKAQMVKNAVIVPVGSKGGFVVKDKSKQGDRELWQKEGIACYQTYLRGLLDLTDNLVDGQVIPPKNTVRYDEDDPYLVVAADKGTATFSDIANGLSAEYNFWLRDAFASGGSAGYDHKGMGITARGAWESVKRHFRLMNKDIQNKDDFRVVGIGDMSGDVFGNGMLLSKHIKLVAAFNHLHIFIDPNPDTIASFAERERLFNLPRSAWTDYDASLISRGGGIFSRSDKVINISDEMKAVFDIQEDKLTPNDLLNRLLKAPVDLIWNGGIGTYIKSSTEDHSEVGDRANDAIRVDGCEVRAKVVGEGGNLGCTQKGRIEYALNGGRVYTDAIDNSGGVNCSDHEVNIKILLGVVMEQSQMDIPARNELLASMTDEVANLVLRQNYLQPQAIELSAFEANARLGEHARFMDFLEAQGRLDRSIEFLPNDEIISKRRDNQQGLTNPEFAVLLAYGKMWVYEQMLASDLSDDAYFTAELKKYFPNTLADKYFEQMKAHRLYREIICTYLTNGLVNRLGIENIFYLFNEAGKSIADITRSYAVVRDVFGIQAVWDKLSLLDNVAPASIQLAIEIDVRQMLKNTMLWFMTHENVKNVQSLADKYKVSVMDLTQNPQIFDKHFVENITATKSDLIAQGINEQDAGIFARLPILSYALDVVKLSDAKNLPSDVVAKAYFGVYDVLNMQAINGYLENLPNSNYWDRRAVNALSQELNRTLLALSSDVLASDFATWKQAHNTQLQQLQANTNDVAKSPSLASLSVLLSEINGLKN